MSIKLLYIGSNCATIERLFKDPQIDLVRRESGFLAYEYIKQDGHQYPDAILAEENIPGLRGVELVKHFKDNGTSGIPFFLVGERYKKDDAELLLRVGISDSFGFDLNPDDVKQRVAFLQSHRNLSHRDVEIVSYRIPVSKRILDIVVAGTALLLLSPFLLVVMLAIRLESKGKVYYISKRVGTGYKIFDFYKLRSMYTGADAKLKDLSHLNQYSVETNEVDADECPDCKLLGSPCSPLLMVDGGEICESFYLKKKRQKSASAFIKIKDDPRITKVGKFIRNTSIDELPQLVNVLKGDMSIVGNRPLPLYEGELLTSDQWILRFMAPAGITGLWQTKKRGKGSMSEEERKGLDNEYALTYSFWNDIKIILKTIPALFQKENV